MLFYNLPISIITKSYYKIFVISFLLKNKGIVPADGVNVTNSVYFTMKEPKFKLSKVELAIE